MMASAGEGEGVTSPEFLNLGVLSRMFREVWASGLAWESQHAQKKNSFLATRWPRVETGGIRKTVIQVGEATAVMWYWS